MIHTYILTGFLGVGKTTLLNRLLSSKTNKINFIIENEFGNVSIDGALVEKNFTELFELNNGCICCSLDSELVEVLAQLIQSEKMPDNLFIEASGVADAGMLAAIFKRAEISKFFELKSIICVLDAENFEDRLAEVPEIVRQIIAADIVAINKCDAVSTPSAEELEAKVLSIHPFAKVQKISFGKLELSDNEINFSQFGLRHQVNQFNLPEAGHRMKSIVIPVPFALDRVKLYSILSMQLFLHYHQVYRIKGFVKFKGEEKAVLVQSTGKNVTFSEVKENPPELVLVFIGKDIERKGLERMIFGI